jgi:hypothetical protein
MILLENQQLKNFILNNYEQEDIFARYLNIPVDDIIDCINNKSYKINNPLRYDSHPSLGFKTGIDGKLRMYDFADYYYRGDIFDIVGIILRKRPIVPKEFIRICNNIIQVMSYKSNVITPKLKTKSKKKKIIDFYFENRPWNKLDIEYWNNRILHYSLLNDVIPVQNIYITLKYPSYTYTPEDPCYCYYLDKVNEHHILKFYFPNRKRSIPNKPRFITNNTLHIEAMRELTGGDVLIITNSRKDALLLKQLLIHFPMGKINISVVSLNGESEILNSKYIETLYSLYKLIVINLDFDRAGIASSLRYRDLYNLPLLFLTNGKFGTKDYGAKDISDFYCKFGIYKTLDLLQPVYEEIINEIEMLNNETTINT